MNEPIKAAFDKVRASEELKSSTMTFISSKAKKQAHRSFGFYRLPSPAIAFLLCLIISITGYLSYFSTASAISVDINPSVELSVNHFDRVIAVKGYNEAGEHLASSLNIHFLNYKDAVNIILESEEVTDCLQQDEIITITVAGSDETRNRKMLNYLKSCTASDSQKIYCSFGHSKEIQAVHAVGLSFGKYQAFLVLKELDPSITTEEIKSLTMRQIHDRISELSGEPHKTHGKRHHGKGHK